MACFSPKPLYQTHEPTLASAALVQANRFAQQGRYDQALRLLDGEAEDSPHSLIVRMVCEWKGLKELDRALATYEVLRACNEAPPPLLAAAARNADSIRLERKVLAIREAQEAGTSARTIQEHASAAYKFEEIYLEEPCTSDLRFHALYGAGLHWYKGEDYSRAAQCVEAALESKEDFAPAWHILGESRRHLGDATGALEAFAKAHEKAETKHVRDAAARGRVEALVASGNNDDALAALEELEVDAEVLYYRGLAKSRLGQHASAVDDLDACASKTSALPSTDVADAVAAARCRAGVASLESGDVLHARRHFSVVASQKYKDHPEHFNARFNVAVCDARSGALDKAAAGFQALVCVEIDATLSP
jgi:tetratricopeptide (TPR) repeat protein